MLQFSANITRGQLTHPQNMIVADDSSLFDFYTGNDGMLRVIQPDVAAAYAQYAQHLYEDGAPPRT